MNIETANRLLQYRKKFGYSQEELASKIGVSRQAVSKWERAEASPDTDNLVLLAQLYGVSLDELITGSSATTDTSDNADTSDSDKATEEAEPEKSGINFESEDGDHVHISFKEGINVSSKNGDKVRVGFDGIHVEEGGKTRAYTSEDGKVHIDNEFNKKHKRKKSKAEKVWNAFPFWILSIIGFFAWGASGQCFGYSLSWVCFLAIPLYYSLGSAIFRRKPQHFAFPVLIVVLYMFFGFFDVCGGWAYGWVGFLTIPFYYWICEIFKSSKKKCNDDFCECKAEDISEE